MMKFIPILGLSLLVSGCSSAQPIPETGTIKASNTSALWGKSGEKWTLQSRLPFFGHAGYRGGGVPIPAIKVVANARDFGATGDGTTDDTAALLRAVAATKDGALLLPAGRYVLRDVINITRSNVVLRGEGPEKSVIYIPNSLEELQGIKMAKGAGDEGKSSFSFSGGFVRAAGKDVGQLIATVDKNAKRGDSMLQLKPTGAMPKVGDEVRLLLTDSDHTLGKYLHADLADAGTDTYKGRANREWINWDARVVAVKENQITLDQPLRLDVRLEWKPEIWSSAPTISEIGVENLGFVFAGKPKKPHLQEEGFNAIHFTGVVNSWVRNVSVTDADIGVILGGARSCTVSNINFLAAKRVGETGHHALWATGGAQDCLFTDFDFKTHYVHDLTVEGFATGNVFRHGHGEQINFDHHRNAPYENLFTDINVGDAKRVWNSSGRNDRGPHSAARATFWNIRADKGNFPPAPDFPQINVISIKGLTPNTTADGPWIEPLDGKVSPPDLYDAQRAYVK